MKIQMSKFTRLIKSTPLKYLLFTAVVASFFAMMQFWPSSGFADPDGYYHAGTANLIKEGKLEDSFPWANFATLRDEYGDQHYIYHLLLIPLTSLEGMHWSVVIFSTLMTVVFVWLLAKLEVKQPFFWGFVMLGSSIDFLFRINVVKANTLSLVLLFIAVWLLAKQKYAWLAVLSALFVWVYGGFVFLPVIAGIYCFSYFVINKKFKFKPFLWVVFGITAGLVLHPHFPDIATHLYYQLFQSGLGAGLNVPVGNEWNPYGFPDLLTSSGLAILAFIISSAIFIVEFPNLRQLKSREGVMTLFLWLTSVFFLLLSVRSRRFVEYSAPFLVLFSAYALNKVANESLFIHIKKALRYWHMKFFTFILAWVLLLVIGFNVSRVWQWLGNSTGAEVLRGSAEWLAQNTNQGDIIFNTKWDGLPQLFYWNNKNYYIIGLDPTFTYSYSHKIYDDWRKIADNDPDKFNRSYEEIKSTLKGSFNSSYIILENSRDDQLRAFLDESKDKGAKKVYTDEYASVYKLE